MRSVNEWVGLIRQNRQNYDKIAEALIGELIRYDPAGLYSIDEDDIESIARVLRAAFICGIDHQEKTNSEERIAECARDVREMRDKW